MAIDLVKENSMKRSMLIFSSIIIFMLAGCTMGTTHIPYVASASPEKLCTLRIAPTLSVTQFNGESVKWIGDFASWGEVQIPEGTHAFILNYNAAHGYQRGLEFTASFAAGQTYSMVAQPMTQRTVRISIVDGAL